jgi:uncharacterized protein YdeI (BOF family)
MRRILILCAAVLIVGVVALVWYLTRPDHYGHPFEGAPKASVKDLLERPDENLNRKVTIEGDITRQCPLTGCWLYLRDSSGKEIRVEMSGTTPTLPQRGGKKAVVEGRFSKGGDSYEIDGKAIEFR